MILPAQSPRLAARTARHGCERHHTFEERKFTATTLTGKKIAALVVCDDPLAHLSITAKQRFSKLPTIALDWQETATMVAARVSIPVAIIGVESGGTIFRADGVPLALRPAIAAQLPADHEALHSLRAALGVSQ